MKLKRWLSVILILAIVILCSEGEENVESIRAKRGLAAPATVNDGPFLPRNVMPTGYHIQLRSYPNDAYYEGNLVVNLSCLVPTNTINLHAGEQLQITKGEISVIKSSSGTENYRQNGNVFVQSIQRGLIGDWLEVILSRNIQTDTHYQLKLEFTGIIGNESSAGGMFSGRYTEDKNDERWFVMANMQQNNARKVFPCFNEFFYKAPFEISIGRPETMSSLSNMALEKTEKIIDEDGWEWDHYKKSPPMSTFSVNFIIFDPSLIVPLKTNTDLDSTSLHIYGRVDMAKELEHASKILSQGLQKVATYLRTKYPLPDFHIVVVPGLHMSYDAFGMKLLSESMKKSRLWPYNVLSEIAGQWLIHLTTPCCWSETNFTNVVTNYVTYTTVFNILQESKCLEAIVHAPFLHYILMGDSLINGAITSSFETGVWLFRMLNYTITENTLRSGLNSFLFDKSYKTYSSDDIIVALNDQSKRDMVLPPEVSVPQIVKSWSKSNRFPVITMFRDYKTGTARVEQQVFIRDEPERLSAKEKEYLWLMPLIITSGENPEKHDIVAWMKEERTITIEKLPNADTFIIINPDSIGKFVVNYDPRNWALLISHMQNYSASLKLSAETRAKFITDTFLLADAGQLTFSTLLDLTLMLRDDNTIKPWYAFFEVVMRIHEKLEPTKIITQFEHYVRKLVSPIYEQNGGYSATLDCGSDALESMIQNMMCNLGAEDCIDALVAEYTPGNDTECSESYRIFKWGPRDLWDKALYFGLGHNDKRYLDKDTLIALAIYTQDQERLHRLLDAVLLKYILSDVDMLDIIGNITNRYVLLNYLSGHWGEVKKRYEKKEDVFKSLVYKATSRFVTSDGYDLVMEFYSARQRDSPKLIPIIRKALDKIVNSSKWYDRSIPQIDAWLKNFLKDGEQ